MTIHKLKVLKQLHVPPLVRTMPPKIYKWVSVAPSVFLSGCTNQEIEYRFICNIHPFIQDDYSYSKVLKEEHLPSLVQIPPPKKILVAPVVVVALLCLCTVAIR
jgi:hypothetical protein